ncbi:MAG: hypothetical protein PHY93_06860 [Bacteriovorax sp.]|nr:hypothetical protein [Bacteriovorax sp.]
MRVIERPAYSLNETELKELRESLKQIVKKSIPKENLNYGIFSETSDAFKTNIITIIYTLEDNRPIAFNSLSWINTQLKGKDEELLHLGLVVIDPDVREGGLSWILYGLTTILLFVRKKLSPIWVSNVTQVPAIIGKVTQSFDSVYPSPGNFGKPPFIHLWLARQIMKDKRYVFGVGPEAEFDAEKFIIKNSYTGGSDHLKKKFSEAQPHRDAIYNDFCKNNLDYDRGDDFIQIGQINLNMTKKFLMKSVPKKSVMRIAISLFFVSLQSVLSPVLLWLDYNHKYGELRPWKK